MAAVTAAVVVGAGSAYAANRQGAAAKKAGRAQGAAAQQAMDKFDQQYEQSRADNQPWLDASKSALANIAAANNGDYSAFTQSPDYQFRYDQGLQGLTRQAAARGNYRGGATDKDIMDYGQGMASQAFGDWYNRQLGMSDRGRQSAQFLGQLGSNYARDWGNAMGVKGQADAQRASATAATQAGYGNALASAFGAYTGAGGNFGGMFGGAGGTGTGIVGQQSRWGREMAGGLGSMYGFGNNPGWTT